MKKFELFIRKIISFKVVYGYEIKYFLNENNFSYLYTLYIPKNKKVDNYNYIIDKYYKLFSQEELTNMNFKINYCNKIL